jgi:hypothetical protein
MCDAGGEKKMRRFVLLIFVLLLLIDLGDDGSLGKARFVNPVSPSAGSSVSSPHCSMDQVDSWCGPPLRDVPDISHLYQGQRLTCNGRQILKKISSGNISSSGGMPF